MNKNQEEILTKPIKWLSMLGFLTLPYTHFNWMPNLGTTRPVSVIFFTLAFGLVVLQALRLCGVNFRAWLSWPKSWDNWPVLRWWVWLISLGTLSAAITPFYGLPKEALTRLLGYFAIFITLFMAAYSLPLYGTNKIARWISFGYLPVLVYAIVETLACLHMSWATQFILWFRAELIVPFTWADRISLLATEPSFVGYQLLLLVFLAPYVAEKWLRTSSWALIMLCLVFTQSGTVIGLMAIYLGLWFMFSLKQRNLSRLVMFTAGLGSMAVLANWLIPKVQLVMNSLVNAIFSVDRLKLMSFSFQIRINYILNLVYAIGDSYGLGLGIGQYGYFWREIYIRHIDYQQFDLFGEVNRALTTQGDYMKPWSVILGIGVDLGVAGLALLAGFLGQVYQSLAEPRHRALYFSCLVALFWAYPIVTPHVWLTLALMASIGLDQKHG